MGIGVQIRDSHVHWMLASTFVHRTGMCILVDSHSQVFWQNDPSMESSNFQLLAWGAGGGKNDASQTAAARNPGGLVDNLEEVPGILAFNVEVAET
jgi:hypothetical protein